MNGEEIKTTPIEFTESDEIVHNVTFETREGMINGIKKLGIELKYGNGEMPVSVVIPENFNTPKDLEFLKSITRKEWLS